MLPAMAGTAVTGILTLSATAMGMPAAIFTSAQIAGDFANMQTSIGLLQGQIDSWAAVILQNYRALDFLTAQYGGTCLFLGEECFYYASKSPTIKLPSAVGMSQTQGSEYHGKLFLMRISGLSPLLRLPVSSSFRSLCDSFSDLFSV